MQRDNTFRYSVVARGHWVTKLLSCTPLRKGRMPSQKGWLPSRNPLMCLPWPHNIYNAHVSSETKRPREQGAAGYCHKILLLKRAKMVLCPFHRSHREISTRDRPVSETKFLDAFWGPLSLPAPFGLLLIMWGFETKVAVKQSYGEAVVQILGHPPSFFVT